MATTAATFHHSELESLESSGVIEIVRCANWDEFMGRIRTSQRPEPLNQLLSLPPHDRIPVDLYGRAIYRGHRDATWQLKSTLQRAYGPVLDPFGGVPFYGNWPFLRSTFEHLAHRVPGVDAIALDELGWWLVGRHYGLVCPYLDWTRSPYVAAFFAFIECLPTLQYPDRSTCEASDFVAVWELFLSEKFLEPDPIRIVEPSIRFAPYTARALAQQSVLTLSTPPEQGLFDLCRHVQSHHIKNHFRLYTIPANDHKHALKDLELMNIRYSTLFPDLFGAALQANVPPLTPLWRPNATT